MALAALTLAAVNSKGCGEGFCATSAEGFRWACGCKGITAEAAGGLRIALVVLCASKLALWISMLGSKKREEDTTFERVKTRSKL